MHRFSRRASPLTTKRPRDHRACTNVVQFHFQDSYTRASSNTFSEAAPPQSRTHVSRVTAPTHHYLTQTRAPASATRLDTVAQASTGCSSTRPRPRRQASPASRRRLAPRDAAGPLVESSPRPRGARRRRFPTTPYGGAAERARVTERVARVYSNDRPRPRLFLYGVSRHLVPTRPAALSSAKRLQQCECS